MIKITKLVALVAMALVVTQRFKNSKIEIRLIIKSSSNIIVSSKTVVEYVTKFHIDIFLITHH